MTPWRQKTRLIRRVISHVYYHFSWTFKSKTLKTKQLQSIVSCIFDTIFLNQTLDIS